MEVGGKDEEVIDKYRRSDVTGPLQAYLCTMSIMNYHCGRKCAVVAASAML